LKNWRTASENLRVDKYLRSCAMRGRRTQILPYPPLARGRSAGRRGRGAGRPGSGRRGQKARPQGPPDARRSLVGRQGPGRQGPSRQGRRGRAAGRRSPRQLRSSCPALLAGPPAPVASARLQPLGLRPAAKEGRCGLREPPSRPDSEREGRPQGERP
jgi:hypothetical protein